jgi:autotransporter translocation and assembly factor TamB
MIWLRRWQKGKRLLFIGGIIGISIIALTAFLAVLPSIPPFKHYILSFVDRQTASLLLCNVSIEAITIDLSKGLVAKNVVLSDWHDIKTPLRADRAAAQIDLPALLRGRFELRSIKIEGLSGELLNIHQGLFAGPVDIGRITALIPYAPPLTRSMVRMISAERCTVTYIDSMAQITTSEIVPLFRLDFIYADSMSFVMQAGAGHFSSPMWSGAVRSNHVQGAIGSQSMLFKKAEVRGDSATLSMHGTIPFSMEKAWDLTANAEAFAAGFPLVYKNVPPLKLVGKLKARGVMTGSIGRPVLDVTFTGYGLQAGPVAADSLFLQTQYSDDLLRGKARLWSPSGTADASVRANISRLFLSPAVGKYTITASAENVDIRHLLSALPRWPHQPVFLADAGLYAAGADLRRLPDTMWADIRESTGPIAASPANVTIRVAHNKWDLTAAMKPDFEVRGNGRYTDSGAISGSFHVQADSIKRIASIFYKETVRGSISADALLSGTLRNPAVTATLQSTYLNWRYILVSKLWGRLTLKNGQLFIDSSYTEANGSLANALQGLLPGEWNGKAWVQAGASGRMDSLRIDGDIRLSQCSYGQYHADTVSVHCWYAGQSLRWQSLVVKRVTSAMQSDGAVSWARGSESLNADCKFTLDKHAAGTLSTQTRFINDSVAASVTAEGLDPAVVSPWFPQAHRLQGSLGVHGTMAGTSENPDIRLTFTFDHAVSGGLVIAAAGDLAYTNSIATATVKAVQKGSGIPVTITAHVPVAWHELSRGVAAIRNGAAFTVSGDSVAYGGLVNAFAPSVQSLGTITLHGTLLKADGAWGLSCSTCIVNHWLTVKSEKIKAGHGVLDLNIAGALIRPEGRFTLNGDSIEYRGSLITAYFGNGSIASDAVKLDTLHISCKGGGADLSAAVPVTFKNGFSFNKNGRISAAFTAMPFSFVQPFIPDFVAINKGVISGRVVVEGADKGFPQGTGTLSLRDGECYLLECDKPLGPLSADIEFKNNSITLRRLQGKWGKGSVAGSGWAVLGEKGISTAKSEIKLKDVHPGGCYENLDLGIQTADINLTKDSLLTITVNALLANTRFTQDYSLIDIGEQLKKKAPQTLRPPNPLFDKVVMRIAVNLNSNLTFDSNLGKMLVDGTVTVAGRPDNPSIDGQFQILNGFVYYLDRKFTITQGAVRQHDPQRVNPSLDVTAISNVTWYPPQGGKNEYDITLLVKGDLSDPVVTLSAVPSLAQPQIISLLTFGTIQTGVGADLGSRTGGALVSQQLAGFGTRKLARFLNVESVDLYGNVFNPSSGGSQVADIYGSTSGPSIEGPQLSVTKQVSPRVAVTYSKGLSKLSQQMVLVSYRILSFLYVEAETDQQAQSGVDLKFRWSH